MSPLTAPSTAPASTPLPVSAPTVLPQIDLAQLYAARSKDLNALLRRAAHMFQSDVFAAVKQTTSDLPKENHMHLLLNLDLDGVRISHLARRSGLRKQTVGKLVHEMAALGTVILKPDPSDGRAKLVMPTESGTGIIFAVIEATRGVIDRYKTGVGQRRMSQLHSTLARLLDEFEEDTD